ICTGPRSLLAARERGLNRGEEERGTVRRPPRQARGRARVGGPPAVAPSVGGAQSRAKSIAPARKRVCNFIREMKGARAIPCAAPRHAAGFLGGALRCDQAKLSRSPAAPLAGRA